MIMKKKHTGFTLIELMVMMAVLAVVMSVGVPQLSIFFKGSRMITNTNDLIGGIHLARSTAIREAGRVTICKSSNADTTAPTCGTTGVEWEDGWFVFIEGTNPGNAIGEFTSADGAILRINNGAEGSDTTISTADADIEDFVSFSSRGLPSKANGISVSGVYMLCDDRGLKTGTNVVARGVILQVTGRVSASKIESKIGVCP